MKIDEVPRQVKDFRPVIQTQLSSSDEGNSVYGESLIYLNSNPLDSDSDASSIPTDEVSTETQNADESMHEGEACVIPLLKKYPTKMKATPCPVCDHEIRGGLV